jgi:formylglycine-generating enzyme required for sulfatase activity
MHARVGSIILFCLAWMAMPALAQQKVVTNEKRVALVIGIGAYQNAPPLVNPPNDARRVAEALRRLNFEVDEAIDVDNRSFAKKLREFGVRAQAADAALVFYGGHGVQVDGENYLIPADAKLEREHDLRYEAMPLDFLLEEVAQAKKVGIVLLDACRNNPFLDRLSRSFAIAGRAARSTQAGLARVDKVPRNTLVVMATRAGEIAEDGGGDDSPFTQAVLAHFRIPGLELSLFFRSVRDTVLKATNNRQEPYVFSSLGAEPFYFFPRPPNSPPVIGQIKPLEVPDTTGPTLLGIPRPTDPDDDPLTIRVVGLPQSGEIRIDGKLVGVNDAISLEKFMAATYKPDGKQLGKVGTFDFVIDDGRGGTVVGVLPITVVSSNHPPVVEGGRTVRVYPGALNIALPTDPDGDPLTVTITGLPGRGSVRNGTSPLKNGDKIRPGDLVGLVYWPEPGGAGDVGALTYVVDDGRGGKAEGKVQIQFASSDEHIVTEANVWQRVYERGGIDDVDAFLRLFPNSRFIDAAKQRREEIAASAVAKAAPAPSPPPASPSGAQPPSETKVATTSAVVPTVPKAATRGPEQTTFQDCPLCPMMVKITAGSFVMGQAGDSSASPVHRVVLTPFALAQHPVTVAEWGACVAERGCKAMPRMFNPTDRTPVHNISWEDAQQFAFWLSQKTGRKYRLPSEAEWEYAARAGTTTPYWWGNEMGSAVLANCADCAGQQDKAAPVPVESFKANAFGLFDMHGGVAQWVADCWFDNYQGAPVDGTAREQKNCQSRVLRGGSFRSDHTTITAFARNHYDASVRYIAHGVRVAADLN